MRRHLKNARASQRLSLYYAISTSNKPRMTLTHGGNRVNFESLPPLFASGIGNGPTGSVSITEL